MVYRDCCDDKNITIATTWQFFAIHIWIIVSDVFDDLSIGSTLTERPNIFHSFSTKTLILFGTVLNFRALKEKHPNGMRIPRFM